MIQKITLYILTQSGWWINYLKFDKSPQSCWANEQENVIIINLSAKQRS